MTGKVTESYRPGTADGPAGGAIQFGPLSHENQKFSNS